MKHLIPLLVVAILSLSLFANAQQPFRDYGYKVKVATLSQGKYQEFFDQDTLVQIGTVILNRLNGRLVYFVKVDTVYSESGLQPELISRWLSPDPLAKERYEYSPYNFSRNNPIIFTDPTGMLDDYYGIVNNTLTYLGNDGQGNNIRLVTEGQHEEAVANLNGAQTTDAQRQTLRGGDGQTGLSQVVTFDENAVQSEMQGANDRTISNQLENSFVVTLDPATATVSAQPGAQGTATGVTNTYTTLDGAPGLWTNGGANLVLGDGHGHPTVTTPGMVNGAGYSATDSNAAGTFGIPTYTIDSYSSTVGGAATVHQAQPGGNAGQNPVGTTQTTGFGRSSFLQVARPYVR